MLKRVLKNYNSSVFTPLRDVYLLMGHVTLYLWCDHNYVTILYWYLWVTNVVYSKEWTDKQANTARAIFKMGLTCFLYVFLNAIQRFWTKQPRLLPLF